MWPSPSRLRAGSYFYPAINTSSACGEDGWSGMKCEKAAHPAAPKGKTKGLASHCLGCANMQCHKHGRAETPALLLLPRVPQLPQPGDVTVPPRPCEQKSHCYLWTLPARVAGQPWHAEFSLKHKENWVNVGSYRFENNRSTGKP